MAKSRRERARKAERKYREANRERVNEMARARYASDPERGRRSVREWRKRNPNAHRGAWLKCKYGLTLDDYDFMLEAQGFGCAICGKTLAEEGKWLAVDHDHETGAVRGLLCQSCNTMLGCASDDIFILGRAIDYLVQGGSNGVD